MQECDVVVVGAGLSGLRAAYDIQTAGLSCVVLEARDRVGGKTWSLLDPTAAAKGDAAALDVGAAWINDTNQSEVYAMAETFGLKTVLQNTVGSVVQEDLDGTVSTFPYGSAPEKLAEEGGVGNMIYIRNLIESLAQGLDISDPAASARHLDDYTLEELVKSEGGGDSAMAMMTVATRAMLGVEPSELSALYFLSYCRSGGGLMQMRSDLKHGGQYLRIAEGTQSFSKCLADRLVPKSLVLNSPVSKIQQAQDGIFVSAERGQYRCQRVIVSLPTPLYKDISFDPALPREKLALSRETKLGSVAKMLLVYRQPWWRAQGLCGMMQSFKGPIAVTRDSSVDEKDLFSLTCFVAGAPGHAWNKLSRMEREKVVVSQIHRTFSPLVDVVPEPIEAVHHIWADDPWSQGCPCPVMPPGVMTDLGHALRTPHGKVHFVGTETAVEWKGYMEGAVRSGERGAKEVVQHLDRPRL